MTSKVREFRFDVPTLERLTKEVNERLVVALGQDGNMPLARTMIEVEVVVIQRELVRLGSPARVAIEVDMDGEPVGLITFDGIDKTAVQRITASGPLVRYNSTPIYVGSAVGSRLLLDKLAGDVRVCIGSM